MTESDGRLLLLSRSAGVHRMLVEMVGHISGEALSLERKKNLLPILRLLESGAAKALLVDSTSLDEDLGRLVREVLRSFPRVPVIVLGSGREEASIALGAGAHDYIPLEELSARSLARSIEYSLERTKGSAADSGERDGSDMREAVIGELTEMIEMAAHQLRHPATVIKGYLALLKEYGDSLEEASKLDAFEGIEEASARLTSLINTLLDTSRIDRQAVKITRRSTYPRAILLRVVSEMSASGQKVPVNVLYPDDDKALYIDPERIKDVLYILVDNACKFTPPGEEVDVWIEERIGEVVFSVADRGPGVPEKDRERIFERFYRVEGGIHDRKPGIGLGLFIAKKYVEAHDGWIKVEPRDGGGSVFSFGIPIEPSETLDEAEGKVPLEGLLRRSEF